MSDDSDSSSDNLCFSVSQLRKYLEPRTHHRRVARSPAESYASEASRKQPREDDNRGSIGRGSRWGSSRTPSDADGTRITSPPSVSGQTGGLEKLSPGAWRLAAEAKSVERKNSSSDDDDDDHRLTLNAALLSQALRQRRMATSQQSLNFSDNVSEASAFIPATVMEFPIALSDIHQHGAQAARYGATPTAGSPRGQPAGALIAYGAWEQPACLAVSVHSPNSASVISPASSILSGQRQLQYVPQPLQPVSQPLLVAAEPAPAAAASNAAGPAHLPAEHQWSPDYRHPSQQELEAHAAREGSTVVPVPAIPDRSSASSTPRELPSSAILPHGVTLAEAASLDPFLAQAQWAVPALSSPRSLDTFKRASTSPNINGDARGLPRPVFYVVNGSASVPYPSSGVAAGPAAALQPSSSPRSLQADQTNGAGYPTSFSGPSPATAATAGAPQALNPAGSASSTLLDAPPGPLPGNEQQRKDLRLGATVAAASWTPTASEAVAVTSVGVPGSGSARAYASNEPSGGKAGGEAAAVMPSWAVQTASSLTYHGGLAAAQEQLAVVSLGASLSGWGKPPAEAPPLAAHAAAAAGSRATGAMGQAPAQPNPSAVASAVSEVELDGSTTKDQGRPYAHMQAAGVEVYVPVPAAGLEEDAGGVPSGAAVGVKRVQPEHPWGASPGPSSPAGQRQGPHLGSDSPGQVDAVRRGSSGSTLTPGDPIAMRGGVVGLAGAADTAAVSASLAMSLMARGLGQPAEFLPPSKAQEKIPEREGSKQRASSAPSAGSRLAPSADTRVAGDAASSPSSAHTHSGHMQFASLQQYTAARPAHAQEPTGQPWTVVARPASPSRGGLPQSPQMLRPSSSPDASLSAWSRLASGPLIATQVVASAGAPAAASLEGHAPQSSAAAAAGTSPDGILRSLHGREPRAPLAEQPTPCLLSWEDGTHSSERTLRQAALSALAGSQSSPPLSPRGVYRGQVESAGSQRVSEPVLAGQAGGVGTLGLEQQVNSVSGPGSGLASRPQREGRYMRSGTSPERGGFYAAWLAGQPNRGSSPAADGPASHFAGHPAAVGPLVESDPPRASPSSFSFPLRGATISPSRQPAAEQAGEPRVASREASPCKAAALASSLMSARSEPGGLAASGVQSRRLQPGLSWNSPSSPSRSDLPDMATITAQLDQLLQQVHAMGAAAADIQATDVQSPVGGGGARRSPGAESQAASGLRRAASREAMEAADNHNLSGVWRVPSPQPAGPSAPPSANTDACDNGNTDAGPHTGPGAEAVDPLLRQLALVQRNLDQIRQGVLLEQAREQAAAANRPPSPAVTVAPQARADLSSNSPKRANSCSSSSNSTISTRASSLSLAHKEAGHREASRPALPRAVSPPPAGARVGTQSRSEAVGAAGSAVAGTEAAKRAMSAARLIQPLFLLPLKAGPAPTTLAPSSGGAVAPQVPNAQAPRALAPIEPLSLLRQRRSGSPISPRPSAAPSQERQHSLHQATTAAAAAAAPVTRQMTAPVAATAVQAESNRRVSALALARRSRSTPRRYGQPRPGRYGHYGITGALSTGSGGGSSSFIVDVRSSRSLSVGGLQVPHRLDGYGLYGAGFLSSRSSGGDRLTEHSFSLCLGGAGDSPRSSWQRRPHDGGLMRKTDDSGMQLDAPKGAMSRRSTLVAAEPGMEPFLGALLDPRARSPPQRQTPSAVELVASVLGLGPQHRSPPASPVASPSVVRTLWLSPTAAPAVPSAASPGGTTARGSQPSTPRTRKLPPPGAAFLPDLPVSYVTSAAAAATAAAAPSPVTGLVTGTIRGRSMVVADLASTRRLSSPEVSRGRSPSPKPLLQLQRSSSPATQPTAPTNVSAGERYAAAIAAGRQPTSGLAAATAAAAAAAAAGTRVGATSREAGSAWARSSSAHAALANLRDLAPAEDVGRGRSLSPQVRDPSPRPHHSSTTRTPQPPQDHGWPALQTPAGAKPTTPVGSKSSIVPGQRLVTRPGTTGTQQVLLTAGAVATAAAYPPGAARPLATRSTRDQMAAAAVANSAPASRDPSPLRAALATAAAARHVSPPRALAATMSMRSWGDGGSAAAAGAAVASRDPSPLRTVASAAAAAAAFGRPESQPRVSGAAFPGSPRDSRALAAAAAAVFRDPSPLRTATAAATSTARPQGSPSHVPAAMYLRTLDGTDAAAAAAAAGPATSRDPSPLRAALAASSVAKPASSPQRIQATPSQRLLRDFAASAAAGPSPSRNRSPLRTAATEAGAPGQASPLRAPSRSCVGGTASASAAAPASRDPSPLRPAAASARHASPLHGAAALMQLSPPRLALTGARPQSVSSWTDAQALPIQRQPNARPASATIPSSTMSAATGGGSSLDQVLRSLAPGPNNAAPFNWETIASRPSAAASFGGLPPRLLQQPSMGAEVAQSRQRSGDQSAGQLGASRLAPSSQQQVAGIVGGWITPVASAGGANATGQQVQGPGVENVSRQRAGDMHTMPALSSRPSLLTSVPQQQQQTAALGSGLATAVAAAAAPPGRRFIAPLTTAEVLSFVADHSTRRSSPPGSANVTPRTSAVAQDAQAGHRKLPSPSALISAGAAGASGAVAGAGAGAAPGHDRGHQTDDGLRRVLRLLHDDGSVRNKPRRSDDGTDGGGGGGGDRSCERDVGRMLSQQPGSGSSRDNDGPGAGAASAHECRGGSDGSATDVAGTPFGIGLPAGPQDANAGVAPTRRFRPPSQPSPSRADVQHPAHGGRQEGSEGNAISPPSFDRLAAADGGGIDSPELIPRQVLSVPPDAPISSPEPSVRSLCSDYGTSGGGASSSPPAAAGGGENGCEAEASVGYVLSATCCGSSNHGEDAAPVFPGAGTSHPSRSAPLETTTLSPCQPLHAPVDTLPIPGPGPCSWVDGSRGEELPGERVHPLPPEAPQSPASSAGGAEGVSGPASDHLPAAVSQATKAYDPGPDVLAATGSRAGTPRGGGCAAVASCSDPAWGSTAPGSYYEPVHISCVDVLFSCGLGGQRTSPDDGSLKSSPGRAGPALHLAADGDGTCSGLITATPKAVTDAGVDAGGDGCRHLWIKEPSDDTLSAGGVSLPQGQPEASLAHPAADAANDNRTPGASQSAAASAPQSEAVAGAHRLVGTPPSLPPLASKLPADALPSSPRKGLFPGAGGNSCAISASGALLPVDEAVAGDDGPDSTCDDIRSDARRITVGSVDSSCGSLPFSSSRDDDHIADDCQAGALASAIASASLDTASCAPAAAVDQSPSPARPSCAAGAAEGCRGPDAGLSASDSGAPARPVGTLLASDSSQDHLARWLCTPQGNTASQGRLELRRRRQHRLQKQPALRQPHQPQRPGREGIPCTPSTATSSGSFIAQESQEELAAPSANLPDLGLRPEAGTPSSERASSYLASTLPGQEDTGDGGCAGCRHVPEGGEGSAPATVEQDDVLKGAVWWDVTKPCGGTEPGAVWVGGLAQLSQRSNTLGSRPPPAAAAAAAPVLSPSGAHAGSCSPSINSTTPVPGSVRCCYSARASSADSGCGSAGSRLVSRWWSSGGGGGCGGGGVDGTVAAGRLEGRVSQDGELSPEPELDVSPDLQRRRLAARDSPPPRHYLRIDLIGTGAEVAFPPANAAAATATSAGAVNDAAASDPTTVDGFFAAAAPLCAPCLQDTRTDRGSACHDNGMAPQLACSRSPAPPYEPLPAAATAAVAAAAPAPHAARAPSVATTDVSSCSGGPVAAACGTRSSHLTMEATRLLGTTRSTFSHAASTYRSDGPMGTSGRLTHVTSRYADFQDSSESPPWPKRVRCRREALHLRDSSSTAGDSERSGAAAGRSASSSVSSFSGDGGLGSGICRGAHNGVGAPAAEADAKPRDSAAVVILETAAKGGGDADEVARSSCAVVTHLASGGEVAPPEMVGPLPGAVARPLPAGGPCAHSTPTQGHTEVAQPRSSEPPFPGSDSGLRECQSGQPFYAPAVLCGLREEDPGIRRCQEPQWRRQELLGYLQPATSALHPGPAQACAATFTAPAEEPACRVASVHSRALASLPQQWHLAQGQLESSQKPLLQATCTAAPPTHGCPAASCNEPCGLARKDEPHNDASAPVRHHQPPELERALAGPQLKQQKRPQGGSAAAALGYTAALAPLPAPSLPPTVVVAPPRLSSTLIDPIAPMEHEDWNVVPRDLYGGGQQRAIVPVVIRGDATQVRSHVDGARDQGLPGSMKQHGGGGGVSLSRHGKEDVWAQGTKAAPVARPQGQQQQRVVAAASGTGGGGGGVHGVFAAAGAVRQGYGFVVGPQHITSAVRQQQVPATRRQASSVLVESLRQMNNATQATYARMLELYYQEGGRC